MAGGNIGNNFQYKFRGDIVAFDVKAGAHIYRGGLVAIDSSGYAIAASDAASTVVMGVAEEEADNTSGNSGDISVRTRRHGLVMLQKGAATAATDVGALVYANAAQTSSANQTVDLAGTTTNDIVVGRVLKRMPDSPDGSTYANKHLLVDLNARS